MGERHWEPNDFQIGMFVRHASLGLGEVVLVRDSTVHVRYDTGRKPNVGIYDPMWFRLHSGMLSPAPSPNGEKT